jgi:hypothetical protein
VLLLSLLLSAITEPLHYGGGNPEILNWWEPFTVSIIDVDVVVVGAEHGNPEILNWWESFTVSIIDVDVVVVGAEQDEGEA